MSLRCFFHADDFGLDQGCSKGILAAVKAGRIQSTSLMPGGADVTSFEQLHTYPSCHVGVHLNLLEGKALTTGGEAVGLVTQDGFFHLTLGRLIWKLTTGGESVRRWVLNEFCAQIDAVLMMFPERPLRLDGHLHVHVLPQLHSVMTEIFTRYKVSYVRTPLEIAYSWEGAFKQKVSGMLRRNLLSYWARPMKTLLASKGIATADYFVGSTASCAMTMEHIEKALAAVIANVGNKDAVIEIMMHPLVCADFSEVYYKDSRYVSAHSTKERKAELDLLQSDVLLEILQRKNIVLGL